jgi:hypothetical protein
MTLDDRTRRRNRIMLLAIFAVFFGSLVVAGALRFSGWRPAGMKNRGELLQPPADLRALTPRLANGDDYRWNPAARTWRIALAPPASCGSECDQLARDIETVRQLLGRDAGRVDVLWLCAAPGCTPPAGAHTPTLRLLQPNPTLRGALPRVDDSASKSGHGVPVYVVDPNGFVILRYAPGSDPGDLRADLAKLLKLK